MAKRAAEEIRMYTGTGLAKVVRAPRDPLREAAKALRDKQLAAWNRPEGVPF